jgi:hypothetical protein
MKYLKRFNESNQEAYQEVTYGEFTAEKEWDDIHQFSQKIIDYVKQITKYKEDTNFQILTFKEANWTTHFMATYNDESFSYLLHVLDIVDPSQEITIGVDKDEWFYVEIRSFHDQDGAYKCDQLEGLFQLLEVKFK